MKTYSFNICKYNIAITIEKRKYETIDRLEMAKDLVKSQPEEIKMEESEHLCFMEAAEKYIDTQHEVLADSTIKAYGNILWNHLNGILLIRLDRLTEEHIQSVFDAEIAKGLSKKTLKGYRSFVLKVLAEYRPDFHPNILVTKENTDENT